MSGESSQRATDTTEHEVQPVIEDRATKPQASEGLHVTRALCEVTAIVSQAPDVLRALDAVLDQVLALTNAEIGAIHLGDRVSGDLDLVATRSLSKTFQTLECRIPKGACLCGLSATLDEPLIVDDLANDPRLSRTACRDERLGAMVGVPLRSRGQTLGILTLYAGRAGAFGAMDRGVLQAIGWQLGAAIDNALWAAALRDTAVAEERRTIASELHDGVAQSLAYLQLQTRRIHELLARGAGERATSEVDAAREAVAATYLDIRELLVTLRTGNENHTRPTPSLRACVEAFERDTRISVDLIGEGELDRLPETHRSTIIRMIRETLTNVRKHARACQVVITCRHTSEWWEVTVSDNGMGCDPARFVDTTGRHLGVTLLRDRAARVGGHVRFLTNVGDGTTVIITVPLTVDEGSPVP